MLEISPITALQVRTDRHAAGQAGGGAGPQGQAIEPAKAEVSPLNPTRVNQAPPGQPLTEEQIKQLRQLQTRDREVRAHEAAHKGAAGGYAKGGASYSYERGPDGNLYAVGGEVRIDTSRPSDPRQALEKAETIQRAALAPAQPSNQDRAVAAAAAQIAAEAQAELQLQESNVEKDAQSGKEQPGTGNANGAEVYAQDTKNAPIVDTFA